jgi:hypothetical protein
MKPFKKEARNLTGLNMMFDRARLERLRSAHKEAEEQGRETFMFDERVLVTRYAYYLLQYLDAELGK